MTICRRSGRGSDVRFASRITVFGEDISGDVRAELAAKMAGSSGGIVRRVVSISRLTDLFLQFLKKIPGLSSGRRFLAVALEFIAVAIGALVGVPTSFRARPVRRKKRHPRSSVKQSRPGATGTTARIQIGFFMMTEADETHQRRVRAQTKPPSSVWGWTAVETNNAQRLNSTADRCLASGNWRMRLPVAAKIALQIAGATGGRAGSPSPVVGYFVWRKCISIFAGASVMRSSG